MKFYKLEYYKSQTKSEAKRGVAKYGKWHVASFSKYDKVENWKNSENWNNRNNIVIFRAKNTKECKELLKHYDFNNPLELFQFSNELCQVVAICRGGVV